MNASLTNALADLTQPSATTTLDGTAKKLQVDADYRVELGSVAKVWTDLAGALSKIHQDGLAPENVESVMYIFRIVRNMVAGVTPNQDRARSAKVPDLIQELISQAAHTHYGNSAYILMLRAGVQALSNLLTGNETSKNAIWNLLLVKAPSPSCDQNLLSTLAGISDETIVLSTVMLSYNCIFESRDRSELLFSTVAGQKLMRQLLLESHAISGQEERKSFEMIYTFFNHLIQQDYFSNMFEGLEALADRLLEEEQDGTIRYHGEDFHKKDSEEVVPELQGLRIEEIQDEEDDIKDTSKAEQTKKGGKKQYLAEEQVILLKMVDSTIYSHHEKLQEQFQKEQQQHTQTASINDPFAVDETDPPVSQETVEFLTQVFVKVSGLTVEIFKTLDKPGVGQHGVEDLANVSSGLILLLGCFAHMSLYEDGRVASENNAQSSEGDVELDLELPAQLMPLPDWFKAQHMAIVQGGVVESAIELLRQADTSLARVTKSVAAMPNGTASTQAPSNTSNPSMTANTESSYLSNTSTTQGQQSFFVGLKRDIVRLVGNLAYRSRHVQDRIRNCNGLIVMLSQCNIDDANPFLREYAILAMKNILTGNVENQALIEELQPIEAVDHPALQEARVTSRLDDQGRPVLSQQKP
ncbi:hypothetical protein BGZ59_008724 [Podila verticillata]|nr:hypothetical protein BGZ59_008724 [Podila verticillata]KFH64470.1 hypothetical protein MVEG_09204 [Podila verticillata NRRL 6337]